MAARKPRRVRRNRRNSRVKGSRKHSGSESDSNLKYRALWLRRPFDYDKQDWAEAQEWMMRMLLRLRKTALTVHAG